MALAQGDGETAEARTAYGHASGHPDLAADLGHGDVQGACRS